MARGKRGVVTKHVLVHEAVAAQVITVQGQVEWLSAGGQRRLHLVDRQVLQVVLTKHGDAGGAASGKPGLCAGCLDAIGTHRHLFAGQTAPGGEQVG